MITKLDFITTNDCAKKFGISRDRICVLSKQKRLTRYYWSDYNKKDFVIIKDNKYKGLLQFYIDKHKLEEQNYD